MAKSQIFKLTISASLNIRAAVRSGPIMVPKVLALDAVSRN
jgi:hypothetical protein